MGAKFLISTILIAGSVACAPAAKAAVSSYDFHVSCATHSEVWQWHVGKFDPGREFLRVSTGTQNPGCSISDANDQDRARLRVVTIRGSSAWIKGIPMLGTVLQKIGKWIIG